MGGAGDTGVCRRFCFGGEKSRHNPSHYFRRLSRDEVPTNFDAPLTDSLNKNNPLVCIFPLTYPK